MDKKMAVKDYFDNYAHSWHDKLEFYGYSARRQCVQGLVGRRKFTKVLDLGCGCGDYALLFDSHSYLGMDLSERMILQARELYPQYEFRIGDAEQTQLNSESWDLVLSVAVLEYLEDPNPHFSEVSRLLKPGGWAVISVQNAEDKSKHRDAKIVNSISFLRDLKRKFLPDRPSKTGWRPEKDAVIVHLRHSERDMADLGNKYGLDLLATRFVNLGVIPGVFDQYLDLNPLFSKIMCSNMLNNILKGYIRKHARCLTMLFQKRL